MSLINESWTIRLHEMTLHDIVTVNISLEIPIKVRKSAPTNRFYGYEQQIQD